MRGPTFCRGAGRVTRRCKNPPPPRDPFQPPRVATKVSDMEQRYLGLFALALLACGPSYSSGGDVKTPDQLLAEQEQLGDEQLKKERNANDYADTGGSTEEEKKREWDFKQSELELKRAAHSAETCPDSVVQKEKGAKASKETKAQATLLFANDGHVKTLTVAPPYDESPVGKCVQRALNAVIVPAYKGEEHTVEWEIDLTGGKKSGPVGGKGDDASKDKDKGK